MWSDGCLKKGVYARERAAHLKRRSYSKCNPVFSPALPRRTPRGIQFTSQWRMRPRTMETQRSENSSAEVWQVSLQPSGHMEPAHATQTPLLIRTTDCCHRARLYPKQLYFLSALRAHPWCLHSVMLRLNKNTRRSGFWGLTCLRGIRLLHLYYLIQ